MEWFLKVCMARLALFWRWRPAGVGWILMCLLSILLINAWDASLSRCYSLGVNPLDLTMDIDSVYALIICSFVLAAIVLVLM